MTSFKSRVYTAVASIPRGYVATYSQIAAMAGCPRAARAVGNAIHTNTDPIAVPCHRVVGSDGRLGSNYGLGGPSEQKRRLAEEGVIPGPDGRIDLTRYGLKRR